MKLISSEMDAETEKWQEINSNAQVEVSFFKYYNKNCREQLTVVV